MKNILAEELKARIDAGEKLNIIDVREPHEHQEFNIGGRLIPVGKILSMEVDEIEDLKDQELILYCRSGARSTQACLFLESMGFHNCNNLVGGMVAWQAKYPA